MYLRRRNNIFIHPVIPVTLFCACLLLLALAFSMTGCVKKPASTVPGTGATPFENVMLYNTALAQSNQDIASVIEGLSTPSSGQVLIDKDTARAILTVQFTIAATDKQLTQILEQGPDVAKGNVTQINNLLASISLSSQKLITGGLVGVKDPAKQAQLSADISAITGLVKLLSVSLQAAGVLQASNRPTLVCHDEVWNGRSILVCSGDTGEREVAASEPEPRRERSYLGASPNVFQHIRYCYEGGCAWQR